MDQILTANHLPVDEHACQKVLALINENSSNVRIQNLVTIGAEYMAVQDGEGISALDNLNVDHHPRWSLISVLDVIPSGPNIQDLIWIDPSMWDMENPSFACAPPCLVMLPPWKGATSTVNYPLITVSDGTWTSTITMPPITVSEWVFDTVTLDSANGKLKKRQEFEEFFPVPATTPLWPAVKFNGPDGQETMTAPSEPFPTPPQVMSPDGPEPPQGSWPQNAIRPMNSREQEPLVDPCNFFAFGLGCLPDPWEYIGAPGAPGGNSDEERLEDYRVCPVDEEEEEPSPPADEPPPLASGSTAENKENCYHAGRSTTHERMSNAISSFCSEIGEEEDVLEEDFFKESMFDYPQAGSNPIGLQIVISLSIKAGCEWIWSADECSSYLHVPVDSCNCGGVNGKQGGLVSNNCYDWRIDPNNKW